MSRSEEGIEAIKEGRQSDVEETRCGIGFIRGAFLQRFANKKAYVFLYGILGCIFSASYAYFNGTITTIEKRFKIPTKITGVITVGNDISQLLVGGILSYYVGNGHRPRWIAFGMFLVTIFCLLNVVPHFLYGPGQDALALTKEYGSMGNASSEVDKLTLCQEDGGVKCDEADGNLTTQIILFVAQFISGIGGTLYYTLGVSYMDDNIKKSKTPALVSFSYFIRMFGPAIGYWLASVCLNKYISPTLTPMINKENPRWLGAWWIGWLVLAAVMFGSTTLIGLFPKTLPRAALRKQRAAQTKLLEKPESVKPGTLKDMLKTFRRLVSNQTLICNNFASVFYFMGYMPYWIFMPKYIETMFRQSASKSSEITGTVGFVFSAAGILIGGLVISMVKPRARPLAMWNVVVGAISVAGIISYAFLGCSDMTGSSLMGDSESEQTCSADCNCTYVKYSPVCAINKTFISPCHAGCRGKTTINNTVIFTNCSCLEDTSIPVKDGACPLDCTLPFYIFLVIVCILKFFGATGRVSNFLVTVRCVDEKDKPVAIAFGLMLMSLFAFIPSPIFFGHIIDSTCLVWGKTCSGKGNCWLYNGESLRYILNLTAAVFVTIGTIFDLGVWYFVENLEIFDEEQETEMKDMKQSETNGVK